MVYTFPAGLDALTVHCVPGQGPRSACLGSPELRHYQHNNPLFFLESQKRPESVGFAWIRVLEEVVTKGGVWLLHSRFSQPTLYFPFFSIPNVGGKKSQNVNVKQSCSVLSG